MIPKLVRFRAASAALLLAPSASAETPESSGAVDVTIHDPAPPQRSLVLEWNPLPLVTVGKLSADAVLAPGDHHALIVSPFYAWTTTSPVAVFDDEGDKTMLPRQKFHGFGAEIGYRYYFERGGPRGLFVGPSFVIGAFTAEAQNGIDTSYVDLGVAGDVGYQILLADRVAIALGGGLQYVAASKSLPDQQFPAWIYANNRLSPRVLFALGWGF